MTHLQEHYESSTGWRISRHAFTASSSFAGGVLFCHGLGDHAGRYQRMMKPFLRRNFFCVGVDLPGHGQSEGVRGHIENFQDVMILQEEALAYLRTQIPSGVPVVLVGQSLGAFHALHFLSEHSDEVDMAWISSPIIDPAEKASSLQVALVNALVSVAPRFTIGSRVRSEMCKRDPKTIREAKVDPLVHRRISVTLGKMLLDQGRKLPGKASGIRKDLPLLMTHGTDDEICPIEPAEAFFNELGLQYGEFHRIEGGLHEPFNDFGREDIYTLVGDWFDRISESKDSPVAVPA